MKRRALLKMFGVAPAVTAEDLAEQSRLAKVERLRLSMRETNRVLRRYFPDEAT